MADSNILAKSGQAMSAYLTTGGVTATIVVGEGTTDKVPPLVSCIGVSSDMIEGQEFTGNRAVTLQVQVVSNAADEAGSHETLSKQVGDLLNTTTLASDLSSALAGFTCIGAVNQGEELDVTADLKISIFNLSLWCCPSDVG